MKHKLIRNQPAAMYWGPEFIAIYNEAYILLAGNKHPTLMVRSFLSQCRIKHFWARANSGIGDELQGSLERDLA